MFGAANTRGGSRLYLVVGSERLGITIVFVMHSCTSGIIHRWCRALGRYGRIKVS